MQATHAHKQTTKYHRKQGATEVSVSHPDKVSLCSVDRQDRDRYIETVIAIHWTAAVVQAAVVTDYGKLSLCLPLLFYFIL